MAQSRLAVLGAAGRMGVPLTEHLLNGGYIVSGWNRTIEKLQTIKDPHGNLRISSTPIEAIRNSDVIISSLFNAAQFHDILDTIKPEDFVKKTFISVMTISPEDSLSLNDKSKLFDLFNILFGLSLNNNIHSTQENTEEIYCLGFSIHISCKVQSST